MLSNIIRITIVAFLLAQGFCSTYQGLQDLGTPHIRTLLIQLVDQFDKNAILENYNKDFGTKDKKVFSQDLLAFITPW